MLTEDGAYRTGKTLLEIFREAARRAGPGMRSPISDKLQEWFPEADNAIAAPHVLIMEVLAERAETDPDLADFRGLTCDCEQCMAYRKRREAGGA